LSLSFLRHIVSMSRFFRAVVMNIAILYDILLCSLVKINHLLGGTFSSACFRLIYCLAYTSALKLEESRSSETSFDFDRTV
jgi:hypothetical protein